ncbi:MAG: hypothetical protein ABI639_13615 [Thermoanaerobaculia bacterium]
MPPLMVAAILIAGFCACVLTYALVRRLQVRHPETWELTGRPSPLGAAFGFGAFGLQRLLLNRRYSELGDPQLISIRRALIAIFLFILACLAFWVRSRS